MAALISKWSISTYYEKITIHFGKWFFALNIHELWKTIEYDARNRSIYLQLTDFGVVIWVSDIEASNARRESEVIVIKHERSSIKRKKYSMTEMVKIDVMLK